MAEPLPAPRPLPADDRREPSLGDPAAPGAELAAEPDGPALSDDTAVAPLVPVAPAQRLGARLDALIDVIVPLTLESPVSGEIAVAHLPGSRRAGKKPMEIEGLNADTGYWELPAHGRRYSEFQAGVLLVNRHGALNEIEYSEFVHKVQAFAEGVGAMADFPDMLEVVARARELDNFSRPLDAQLSVKLRAHSVAWSVGYVQQCAARQGFVPGVVPGRLVVPGAGVLEPIADLGDQVAVGDAVAVLHHWREPDRPPRTLLAEVAGTVIDIAARGLVQAGDHAAMIGEPFKEASRATTPPKLQRGYV
jgi:hypothetical protein